ncbi:MAG: isopentenyl-diphosphate Delta-isomerase [Oscillospiraceae bacterium]|nr:isopentenyl-diphosphate Delta-isomerase [Oscillospiraceae bacterium]
MKQLILTDLYDRQIGTASKEQAHARGLLHRAFSVFIHDGRGRMLIQRRAADKYHSGGLWANACCSHPLEGETPQQAAHRRLPEEMGFDCPLQEQFSFVYFHRFGEELYEYEYDHVFLGEYTGAVLPDPSEAQEICWIPFEALERDLKEHPERYCVWFITAAPRILEALRGGGQ